MASSMHFPLDTPSPLCDHDPMDVLESQQVGAEAGEGPGSGSGGPEPFPGAVSASAGPPGQPLIALEVTAVEEITTDDLIAADEAPRSGAAERPQADQARPSPDGQAGSAGSGQY